MKTEWKAIVGYEGLYEVSNTGLVKSLERNDITGRWTGKRRSERLLTQSKGKSGYYTVSLAKDNISTTYFVHRLVALSFIPNILNKICVNHKDFNKSNNNVDNLEWTTTKENLHHSYLSGNCLYNYDESKLNKDYTNTTENKKGRKQKFNDETCVISFRVPNSKKDIIYNSITEYLQKI